MVPEETQLYALQPPFPLAQYWQYCDQRAWRLMPGEAAVQAQGAAGCSDARRFELELEFVQCFASPDYLNCE